MSLSAKDVSEIMRLVEESTFDELLLEIEGVTLHLRRGGGHSAPVEPAAPREAKRPSPAPADSAPPSPAPVVRAAPAGDPNATPVKAPLLGTFYRAPKPGAPPYVEVGTAVEPETIIGIIEVMKLMNTVRAGTTGTVREILAKDGVLVEFDDTLMTIAEAK